MPLKNNVSEIKRLVHERKEAGQLLIRFLISKGIAQSIAEEIVLSHSQGGAEMGSIKDIVAAKIRVTGELSFKEPHKLVFVGPTGVGKTTTLQKLARHYTEQKKGVALMSLDKTKRERLKAWAEEQEIKFTESSETACDLLLIDTEGCNYYLPSRIDSLGETITEIGEGLEIVLTLSAAAKEVDLYGAVHQFSPLCPTSLVFTKLDETLQSGVLVNLSTKTNLPLRYVAYGFPLPGEVQIANSHSITHKILTDFNKQEFQLIRQITLTLN